MKTFITLGIVLKISEDTIYQLEHVLDLIETYQEEITIMHPDEGDYNHWEEETILGKDIYQLIDKLAYRNAFAKIIMDVNGKAVLMNLQTRNEDDQILIELEFDQNVLESSYGNIEAIDTFLQAFVTLFAQSLDYEYIYADHEADYLYSATRIKELEYVPYSLLKMPSRNLTFAEWYPDKMTLRPNTDQDA